MVNVNMFIQRKLHDVRKAGKVTNIANKGSRLQFLEKLIDSWPVSTLNRFFGALLVNFMDVGLLQGHRPSYLLSVAFRHPSR